MQRKVNMFYPDFSWQPWHALISTKSGIIVNPAPVWPLSVVCQMRHLAPKTKYLAEKSLAGRTHRSGQGWQMQLCQFFSPFMLLPIHLFALHASDTNGLMVAKPVTCLPNWLLHYGSPQQMVSYIANQIRFFTKNLLNLFSLFPFQFLTFECECLSVKARSWILITSQLFQ